MSKLMSGLMFLPVLLSFAASAQSSDWTPVVAAKKVALIKRAVGDSLSKISVKCSGTIVKEGVPSQSDLNFDIIRETIQISSSVAVKSDSSQPLIQFKNLSPGDDQRIDSTILVSTTPDLKTITGLQIDQVVSETSEQNVGTLNDPNFQRVSHVTMTINGSCQ